MRAERKKQNRGDDKPQLCQNTDLLEKVRRHCVRAIVRAGQRDSIVEQARLDGNSRPKGICPTVHGSIGPCPEFALLWSHASLWQAPLQLFFKKQKASALTTSKQSTTMHSFSSHQTLASKNAPRLA